MRQRFLAFASAVAIFASGAGAASADDGYDSTFAQSVRAATGVYRLELWARSDGYVQSTDYMGDVGVMFTNHDRFDPVDLAHPTVLIYDEAGRLVAVEYQFVEGSKPPAAFSSVPAGAWFEIPRHVHYNIVVGGTTYYAQAAWTGDEQPTADVLRERGLMPSDGTLLFAFVHPPTRSIIVWAWLPNQDGLFAGENALLP